MVQYNQPAAIKPTPKGKAYKEYWQKDTARHLNLLRYSDHQLRSKPVGAYGLTKIS
jgi:hypothetical protein